MLHLDCISYKLPGIRMTLARTSRLTCRLSRMPFRIAVPFAPVQIRATLVSATVLNGRLANNAEITTGAGRFTFFYSLK